MIVVQEITNKQIDKAANKADVNATKAQKEAGNYKLGRFKLNGFEIAIENPKGSKRYYTNPDGTTGYNTMKHHYGYFVKTKGYDGDAVDVFVGTYLDFDKVYVVDQNNEKGKFDESKVMLGFRSEKEAKDAYFANFSKDWKGFRSITTVSIDDFKEWLYDGKKQRKPFSEYKSLKEMKILVKEALMKTLKEHGLIDSDDEVSGYSKEYEEGVEYIENLLAKSKDVSDIYEILIKKEASGQISTYERGMLDTLDDYEF